jgi:serine/threonine protein kinase
MGQSIPKNNYTIPEKSYLLENTEQIKRENHPEFGEITFLKNKLTGDGLICKQMNQHSEEEKQNLINFLAFRQGLNSTGILHLLDFSCKEKHGFCSTHFKIECFYEDFESDLKSDIEYRKVKKIYYSEEEVLEICASVATGLKFLQENGIPMVEIKPANILKTKSGYKLSNNMGSSTDLGEVLSSLIARPVVYVAPEVWAIVHNPSNRSKLNDAFEAGVFSLGLILLEIGTLEPLTNLYKEKDLNEEALQNRFEEFHARYPDLEWLVHFFALHPENRFTPSDILAETGRPGETKQKWIQRQIHYHDQEENCVHKSEKTPREVHNSHYGEESENLEKVAQKIGMSGVYKGDPRGEAQYVHGNQFNSYPGQGVKDARQGQIDPRNNMGYQQADYGRNHPEMSIGAQSVQGNRVGVNGAGSFDIRMPDAPLPYRAEAHPAQPAPKKAAVHGLYFQPQFPEPKPDHNYPQKASVPQHNGPSYYYTEKTAGPGPSSSSTGYFVAPNPEARAKAGKTSSPAKSNSFVEHTGFKMPEVSVGYKVAAEPSFPNYNAPKPVPHNQALPSQAYGLSSANPAFFGYSQNSNYVSPPSNLPQRSADQKPGHFGGPSPLDYSGRSGVSGGGYSKGYAGPGLGDQKIQGTRSAYNLNQYQY